jgi:hypothetical protein
VGHQQAYTSLVASVMLLVSLLLLLVQLYSAYTSTQTVYVDKMYLLMRIEIKVHERTNMQFESALPQHIGIVFSKYAVHNVILSVYTRSSVYM